MAIQHPIPIDLLRQLLRLDPETGRLYWLHRGREWFGNDRSFSTWNARYAGAEALTAVNDKGYRLGKIFGRSYMAHRVVFALAHGRWPEGLIDHRDGDTGNNPPRNLREASQQQNQRNSGGRVGSSRYKGVAWDKRRETWQAWCRDQVGRQRSLGYFLSEVDAALAYDRAARTWHGEFARLNFS